MQGLHAFLNQILLDIDPLLETCSQSNISRVHYKNVWSVYKADICHEHNQHTF